MMMGAKAIDKGLVFTKEEEILITGDSWVLSTDISLHAFYNTIAEFDNLLDEAMKQDHEVGKGMDSRMATYVNEIVSKELNIIQNDLGKTKTKLNNLVKTIAPFEQHREKRGLLDIGGVALKFLFGTADSDDLIEINKKIDSLAHNSDGIVNIINDQVSVIKDLQSNQQKFNENLEKIKIITSLLSNKVENMTRTVQNTDLKIVRVVNLDSAIRTAEYVLTDVKESISDLGNALEATALKKLSPIFLNPTLLLRALTEVQNNLPTGLSLVTSNIEKNIFMYYDISTVRAVYFNRTIRLFAEIPLKAPERYFDVFRALPLPYAVHNESARLYIEPSYEFFAIAQNNQFYFELDTADLSNCKDGSIKICPPFRPVRRISDVSCLSSLYVGNLDHIKSLCDIKLTHDLRSQLYRTKGTNAWIYSVEKDLLTFNCPSQAKSQLTYDISSKIIKGTGIIQIPASCTVHNENYFLLSHSITATKINPSTIFVPPLEGNIIEISNFTDQSETREEIQDILSSINTDKIENSINVKDWYRKIQNLRADKSRQIQNVHLSFSIVTIVAVCLSGVILYRYKDKICRKPIRNNSEVIPINHLPNFEDQAPKDLESKLLVPQRPLQMF